MVTGCQMNSQSCSRPTLPPIDHILVEKSQRTISVFNNDQQMAKYKISLGKSPIGHKEKEGDHKTPEGVYTIIQKNPNDLYFKSLTISYPNEQDCENAAKNGVSPGGGIQIHGYDEEVAWVSQEHKLVDATRGCILLTNPEMAQIFAATEVGTKIVIKP